jgi:hypothetical protein
MKVVKKSFLFLLRLDTENKKGNNYILVIALENPKGFPFGTPTLDNQYRSVLLTCLKLVSTRIDHLLYSYVAFEILLYLFLILYLDF